MTINPAGIKSSQEAVRVLVRVFVDGDTPRSFKALARSFFKQRESTLR